MSSRLLKYTSSASTDTVPDSIFDRSRISLIKFNRSEEHTSELQSLAYLVCRLLLEKKKNDYLKFKLQNIIIMINNLLFTEKNSGCSRLFKLLLLFMILFGTSLLNAQTYPTVFGE